MPCISVQFLQGRLQHCPFNIGKFFCFSLEGIVLFPLRVQHFLVRNGAHSFFLLLLVFELVSTLRKDLAFIVLTLMFQNVRLLLPGTAETKDVIGGLMIRVLRLGSHQATSVRNTGVYLGKVRDAKRHFDIGSEVIIAPDHVRIETDKSVHILTLSFKFPSRVLVEKCAGFQLRAFYRSKLLLLANLFFLHLGHEIILVTILEFFAVTSVFSFSVRVLLRPPDPILAPLSETLLLIHLLLLVNCLVIADLLFE